MNQEAVERKPQFNPETEVRLTGRVLWLTKDPRRIRHQIDGEDYYLVPKEDLAENVSTDEIIPSRYCFYFTPEELGEFALTGFRGGVIGPGDIKRGNFEAIVAGPSFGCGSSREHAPICLKGAGIKFIVADPIERIFLANSQNLGLYPIQFDRVFWRLLDKGKIDKEKIADWFDPISADIIRKGGLLPYLAARVEGKVILPEIDTNPGRPMTMIEKIIARHLVTNGKTGVPAVKPGDAGFVKSDFTYSYEIMTPLAETALKEQFGNNVSIVDKENIALFEDHTALAETLKNNPETAPLVAKLLTSQRKFARKNNIHLYPPNAGICHNVVVEKHALPGQVIPNTDSHGCSQGVVGALANGIGATEMAGVWLTGDVRVTVPETWRINFYGKLQENVMAKDIMLYLFTDKRFEGGGAVGKVLEFAGTGLKTLSFDELFVLPNMAVEGGAFTGIVEPNEVVINFLVSHHRQFSRQQLEKMIVKSDKDAEFEEKFDINLSKIPLMVATPGDPRNAVPLAEVAGQKADVVYDGSCTAGKDEDLTAFAKMLPKNEQVKIPTFIQASSQDIQSRVERIGLFKKFKAAGITILEPGCGDCCNLGRGIAGKGEIIVSATNRNFPNRMGPADVFLVNPKVAAVTAILGRLPTPEEVYRFSKAT